MFVAAIKRLVTDFGIILKTTVKCIKELNIDRIDTTLTPHPLVNVVGPTAKTRTQYDANIFNKSEILTIISSSACLSIERPGVFVFAHRPRRVPRIIKDTK